MFFDAGLMQRFFLRLKSHYFSDMLQLKSKLQSLEYVRSVFLYPLMILLTSESKSYSQDQQILNFYKEQIQLMMHGKVILHSLRKTYGAEVVAAGIIKASLDQIRKTLLDCNKHPEFMPLLKECRIDEQFDDSLLVTDVIDPPFMESFQYHLITKLYPDKDHVLQIVWELDKNRPSGPIERNTGYWLISPVSDELVILIYSADLKVKLNWILTLLFDEVINFIIRHDLPRAIENMRARIESNGEWKFGMKLPQPKVMLAK